MATKNIMKSTIFWDITPCSPLNGQLIFRPWRWRRYVPPKRRLTLNGLHGVISEKIVLFITTAVRTSNPTKILCFINVSVYTIRGTDIPYVFTFTTCFDLMWPSSGTWGLTITYFFPCYSPYTGQCLHIGSALYVWVYVMPCVPKCTEYLKY
jgi:hypothetical protein